MSKFIDQLVNEQIRKSQLAMQKCIESGESCCQSTVITISRTMGSGARIVAQRLAEELGFSLWSKELLDYIAESRGVPQKLVETFDEKSISEFEVFTRAAFGDNELGGFIYPKHLSNAIRSIAKNGNAIILGRGGNFILPDALHIRIDASFEHRVQNMMKFEGLTKEQAEAKLRASDRDRYNFLVRLFGKERVAKAVYDLTIWMDRLTIEGAANVIKMALFDRCKQAESQPKPEPKRKVQVTQNI